MDHLLANTDAVTFLRRLLGQEQVAAALGPSAHFHLEAVLDEAVPSECDLHGVVERVAIALLAPAQLERSARERIEERTGLYSDVGLLGHLEFAQRILHWLCDQLEEVWDPSTGVAEIRSRADAYVFRAVPVPARMMGESAPAYRERLWESLDSGILTDSQPLR